MKKGAWLHLSKQLATWSKNNILNNKISLGEQKAAHTGTPCSLCRESSREKTGRDDAYASFGTGRHLICPLNGVEVDAAGSYKRPKARQGNQSRDAGAIKARRRRCARRGELPEKSKREAFTALALDNMLTKWSGSLDASLVLQ
jgi:hypothetical protein